MNIMHIISGGDTGGAKTHVISLTERLSRTENVRLVCFTEGEFAKEARDNGVNVTVIEGNPLTAKKELLSLIKADKTDIIHCHGAKGNMMGMLIGRKAKIPKVTTIHSDYKLDYMGRPLSALTYGTINKISLRKFDGWIGVSDVTSQMMADRGFKKDRIFTLYNGVDFDIEPVPMPRADYLSSIGVEATDDTVIFGIMARLSPVKDITTLIKAFADAIKKYPDMRLIIAGDGEEAEALKALAREITPEKAVTFAGWVSDKDSFYNAIDVNMLTSVSEGFPYVLPEGARLHCAEIASNVGGIPSLIEDGKTGFLFTPGDTDTLSSLMVKLASDKDLRISLAASLYEKAKSDFSVIAMAKKQTAIYNDLIKMKRK